MGGRNWGMVIGLRREGGLIKGGREVLGWTEWKVHLEGVCCLFLRQKFEGKTSCWVDEVVEMWQSAE